MSNVNRSPQLWLGIINELQSPLQVYQLTKLLEHLYTITSPERWPSRKSQHIQKGERVSI